MARVIIADASMEKVFTAVRRRVLELLVSDADFLPEGAPGTDFLYALATQCFLTEYVYNVTSAEREWLDLVRPRAGELPLGTVIMAAYEPLQGGPEDWDSALGGGEGPLDCLITSQVIEPRRELELRDKLPCLTTLEDATSQAVRELYEENPYPRWSSVRHGA